jgi:NADH:ubiquinone oxidoreductase subunit K
VTFARNLPRLATRAIIGSFALWLLSGTKALANEAKLAIPDLHLGHFNIAGQEISAWNLLFYGALVITGTLGISLYLRNQIKNLPAHESMLNISEIIFQTCKTYLVQQGKFLIMLFAIIGSAMAYSCCCFRSSVWAVRIGSPGTVSASTPMPTRARRSPRCVVSLGTW